MIKKIIDGKLRLHPDEYFSRLEIEAWLIKRCSSEIAIDKHIRFGIESALTEGTTTFEERRDRIRDFLLLHDLGANAIGKRADGVRETFAGLYFRFYGEPLPSKIKEPSC